jgi:hypothetical protein
VGYVIKRTIQRAQAIGLRYRTLKRRNFDFTAFASVTPFSKTVVLLEEFSHRSHGDYFTILEKIQGNVRNLSARAVEVNQRETRSKRWLGYLGN